MSTRRLIPLLTAVLLASCVGTAPKKTALSEAVAPPMSEVTSLASLGFKPVPMGCPVYAGDDRPDYDADAVACIVKWMQQTQDYLAMGGKPTEDTDKARFEKNRLLAKERLANLSKFLDEAAWGPRKAPPQTAAAAPKASGGAMDSRQHYLSGIVFFQKGDYEKARAEWLEARRLDPANKDAVAGLERIEKLYGKPSP